MTRENNRTSVSWSKVCRISNIFTKSEERSHVFISVILVKHLWIITIYNYKTIRKLKMVSFKCQ